MKLSTSYLKECAKANDWLQFIIHSQLHNYHPEEVSCHHVLPTLQEEEIGRLLEGQIVFFLLCIPRVLFYMILFLLRFQWVGIRGLVISIKELKEEFL